MSDIIDDMGGGYAILPRIVRKCPQLSDGAKLCYMAIVDYAFNNLFCFPSQQTLADEMGVGIWSVSQYLRELREFGMVRVYQPTTRGGRDVNHYIVMPLREVPNLRREKPELLDRDEQYVDKAGFDALVEKHRQFYKSLNVYTDDKKPPKRSKSTSWVSKVERYNKLASEGKFSEMSANDLCVGFAIKYEEKYGEPYAVNWRTDSQTIKVALLNKGIESEGADELMAQFILNYDRLFKSADYPVPRIVHLKVDWIFRKLMRHIEGLVAAAEFDGQETTEIVGEWDD